MNNQLEFYILLNKHRKSLGLRDSHLPGMFYHPILGNIPFSVIMPVLVRESLNALRGVLK